MLWALVSAASAQDSPLSQWCNNMLATNPAFAGSADKIRLNIFYRNQWPDSDAGFQYFGGAADMPVAKNMGCGILFSNDKASLFSRRQIEAAYSYNIKADTDKDIYFGIKIGITQKSISSADLVFEQTEIISSSASIRPDCGLGAAVMLKNVFASFSAEHLMRPQQSISQNIDSRTNIKLTFDIGYVYNFSPLAKKINVEIMPNIIYQQQGKQQNLQFGVISQVNWMLAGLALRKDIGSNIPTSIITLGYSSLDFRIAYSYDIDMNKKTNKIGNAHEVSITKLFDIKRKEKKKSIECPSFLR